VKQSNKERNKRKGRKGENKQRAKDKNEDSF
jgi:hypothetical protein